MACKRPSTEVRAELTKGWKSGALAKQYTGFDASLLSLNEKLSNELLYASHLIQLLVIENESPSDTEENACQDEDQQYEIDTFVDVIANNYTLDRVCGVCQILSEYKKKFPLKMEWLADYALLCHKSQAIPLCATSTFVTAFEFVYVMDKHYFPPHGASLVGEFGRRNLFFSDIQKHFFLNGCFTQVDGGLESKIDLNNYSFLVQSVARYAVTSFSEKRETNQLGSNNVKLLQPSTSIGETSLNSPKTSSTAVALLKWRDYARPLECFGRRKRTIGIKRAAEERESLNFLPLTCVQSAERNDLMYETETNSCSAQYCAETTLQSPTKWAFSDLTALLLAGTNSLQIRNDPSARQPTRVTEEIVNVRHSSVMEYHASITDDISSEQPSKKNELLFISSSAKPAVKFGPILASTLPHPGGRGGTGAECLLCNLMLIEDYWHAIRLFKSRVVGKENTNTSLFDGLEPAIDEFEEYVNLSDGGRMLSLLKEAGPNAIYKHLFCDPMCAANTLRTNPGVLWGNPPSDFDGAELYKATLAAKPNFSERVCRGLWILAFVFKAYQLTPLKPTALNTFIRGAESYLKRHGLSCIALEHALTRYV
ncbi:Packaging protein UL32 [Cacatuid alphaherpesvirus 2]|uniref:Packaging protein UL32 n=1 Tax=Cacatuid alphaherpesvirus 2 TaxID=2604840 RepID=A0A5B9RBR5_9ALPH|nr:Packaging protein UL32 [Cacatuid alphaherpesvirus 2]QEG54057.1 Packaging protein UL32 [Cacatuid alphaherpesvirus 2]